MPPAKRTYFSKVSTGPARPKNSFEHALAHMAIDLGNAIHERASTEGAAHMDIATPDGTLRLSIKLRFSKPNGENPITSPN